MALEEVAPESQSPLVQPYVPAIAPQEAKTASPPKEVAEVVPHDGARRCSPDHQCHGEMMGRTGIDRGSEQGGLARSGDAHALHSHDEQDGPVAVRDDEVTKLLGAEEIKHFVWSVLP